MGRLNKILVLLGLTALLFSCTPSGVRVRGGRLLVDGNPYTVLGMNWSCYPIGTNWAFNIWEEPDSVVAAQLDYDFGLMRDMGVNTVRIYNGVPARWIEYIWERFGIRTMVNCTQGRYGLTVRGEWEPHTDYSDADVREMLVAEARNMALRYKGTPGLLAYLLGNENNYGLFWDGAETEDIPEPDSVSTARAEYLYSLLNESALVVKAIDPSVPVAVVNGDLLFLDMFVKECPDVDIFGVNTYRGASFTDLFERVADECPKPLLLTEFGSDAYNVLAAAEEQDGQAEIDLANWREILAESATGRCLGGFTFQWSDEWWKHGQDVRLCEHDTEPSWHNGGYYFDYVKGSENMNEEWFGICAKHPYGTEGRLYDLVPRKVYYELMKLYETENKVPSAE